MLNNKVMFTVFPSVSYNPFVSMLHSWAKWMTIRLLTVISENLFEDGLGWKGEGVHEI
jgi:hypothetical protein